MVVVQKKRRILYFYGSQDKRPQLTERRFACPVGKMSGVYELSAEISAISPAVVFAAVGAIDPFTWRRLQAKHRDVTFVIRGERRKRRRFPAVKMLPRPQVPSVSRLAVVTSFFNPHRGQRRVAIYGRFAEAIRKQGLPLFCMEGLFNGSPQVDSTWQVAIDPEAVFWHKENLLNLAIDRLSDEFDAVAWIDADVIYEESGLGDKILDALARDPIVQPWSQIRYLGPDDEPISAWRASMSFYNSLRQNPDADPRHSYPGMAWAASRETLAKIGGIYDRCITGGGDVAWAAGVWGDRDPIYGRQWSDSLVADSVRWGEGVTKQTGGRCGAVTAKAEHLYHGSIHDRQYTARNAIFSRVDFDPRRDVEVAANGTLRWSKHATDVMRRAIGEYMHNRKEDE